MLRYSSKSIVHLSEQIVKGLQTAQADSANVVVLASKAARASAEGVTQLNPLCHPLQVTDTQTAVAFEGADVVAWVTVEAVGDKVPKIEAMFAGAAAAVTIWDIALSMAKKDGLPYAHFCFECLGVDAAQGETAV